MSEMRIMDGSGLSRLNLVKPREMVKMLEYMHAHRYRDIYVESLPRGGRVTTGFGRWCTQPPRTGYLPRPGI